MKLRQTLAVGAASALLTPAFGALVASPAHAVEEKVTLAVASPGVVGVHAEDPLTFDAKIGNAGGEVHSDARLFLKLTVSEFFLDRKDEVDPSALKLEYKNAAGEFKKIDLTVTGEDEVTGSPDVKFLQEDSQGNPKPTETLTLRLAVDDPKQKDLSAASKAKGAKAAAASRAKALAGKGVKATSVGEPPGTECAATMLGFTLNSSLSDVDEAGKPVGQPIATDTDDVEIAEAAVSFEGLSGDIVAGATPKAFKLTLCNPSDSAFDNVAAELELFRGIEGDNFATLNASDVVLEIGDGKNWVPVPVEQDEEFVVAFLADENGNGIPLAAHQKDSAQLRLGFKKGAKPGEGGSVATAVLPKIEKVGGFSLASFQIVEPKPVPPGQGRPSPELPDTGGNMGIGLLGAGLLVAGAGAVMVTRRRRETA